MKLLSILPVVAALASSVNAIALIANLPNPVTVGKSYEIQWLQDTKASIELELVRKEKYGWALVKQVFYTPNANTPGGNFTWEVSAYPADNLYAIHLDAGYPDGESGYGDITTWFHIQASESDHGDLKA